MKKITICNTKKYKKLSWNELYSSSFTKLWCSKMALYYYYYYYTHLTALCPGLPGWASTRKVKPIWILLEQEIVSGSGISWAICKSAPRSRQITTPAPHHSVFYRPDALPATQPTASKHWRLFQITEEKTHCMLYHSMSMLLRQQKLQKSNSKQTNKWINSER